MSCCHLGGSSLKFNWMYWRFWCIILCLKNSVPLLFSLFALNEFCALKWLQSEINLSIDFFNCPLGREAQFYTFIFVETKRMFCWHLMSFCSKKYCITNNKRCNKNYRVPFLSMMPENEFWLEKPLDPNKKYWISIYS